MRYFLTSIVLGLTVASTDANATIEARMLWSYNGESVWAVACNGGDVDARCVTIEARSPKKFVRGDQGYDNLVVLWKRSHSTTEPVLIAKGDLGGSAGCQDFYAVTFAPEPVLQKLESCHTDQADVADVNGEPEFDIGFSVEGFGGAPDSLTSVALLPIHWNGHRLDIDLGALAARSFNNKGVEKLRESIRRDIRQWREAGGEGNAQVFPYITTQILLRLMLSGHADLASATLFRAWPSHPVSSDGLADSPRNFWNGLCQSVVSQELWTGLRLQRIPHAALIETAARN